MRKILTIYNDNDKGLRFTPLLRNALPECAVETALSGLEGVERAETVSPDAILLDIKTPGIDELEVLKRLKSGEITKNIPVIVLSDDTTDTKSHIEALELGAIAFLDKSIDENVLIAQINASLGMKEVQDLLCKEKKDLEALLQHAQKTEAIGRLTGGIAHEFNNILTAIIGYTEITLGNTLQDTKIQRNLEEVLKAGYRARDLVKQLLTFSRQTAQDRKALHISLIIKEATKMLRASLPANIEIRQYTKNGSAKVMVDPTQIHQVLINLCTNAADSMREKGGIMEVGLSDIDVDSHFTALHPDLKSGPYVKLSVSDTGHGMPRSMIKKIFDPHFSTKTGGNFTGLGLAVVRGIVKSHGGAMTVYSEPEKGTTFSIFFPRVVESILPDIGLSASLPGGNERILFIDDEEVLANLGKQMLEPLGYTVTTKTDSTEALEAFEFRPQSYDLVITDMTMPKITGLELAEKLLQIRTDIPIILCTGFSEMVTRNKATAIGIQEFVMKPIDLSEMAEIARRVLDKKSSDGESHWPKS